MVGYGDSGDNLNVIVLSFCWLMGGEDGNIGGGLFDMGDRSDGDDLGWLDR